MGAQTGIQWCDGTLNLWTGCTKVSDGCKFCYAEYQRDGRFKQGEWGPKGKRTEVKSWRSTLNKISKQAKTENRRLKVFCSSLSDVFEGPETMGGADSENWKLVSRLRLELMMAIQDHPELDFLLLTKRPANAVMFFSGKASDGTRILDRCRNLGIGTSVEDQKTANERIPHLLKIPAAVRFLSCEPLLGPVDLSPWIYPTRRCLDLDPNWPGVDGNPRGPVNCISHPCCECPKRLLGIHWLICGGESGPNARPMHPNWARSLRDQCQSAGVPFFYKQVGEWTCYEENSFYFQNAYSGDHVDPHTFPADLTDRTSEDRSWLWSIGDESGNLSAATVMHRVGKARAGRLLDGREWNEFPEVQR